MHFSCWVTSSPYFWLLKLCWGITIWYTNIENGRQLWHVTIRHEVVGPSFGWHQQLATFTNWVFTHKVAICSGNSQLKHKHKPREPAFHWIESLSSLVLTIISSCSDISMSKRRLYSSGVTLNPLSLLCRPAVPLSSLCVLTAYTRACCCRA